MDHVFRQCTRKRNASHPIFSECLEGTDLHLAIPTGHGKGKLTPPQINSSPGYPGRYAVASEAQNPGKEKNKEENLGKGKIQENVEHNYGLLYHSFSA